MKINGVDTSTQNAGTYGLKSWDEKTWEGKDRKEQPGAKLTHAKIIYAFEGGFQGEAEAQLLMAYRDDTYAIFNGWQRMTGRLGDRSGSFVIEVQGVFENGAAKSNWKILPGLGTG